MITYVDVLGPLACRRGCRSAAAAPTLSSNMTVGRDKAQLTHVGQQTPQMNGLL